MIPLFKKCDKSSISNYRLIFVLTPFTKVIGRIIYKRLYDHIYINNILVKEQFGFRTSLSIEIAAYILINNILSSLNNNYWLLFCFVTCKKHLTLNHEILLSVLRFYGILGVANKLIKSYLQDRYQRVLINIENSNIFLNGSK
jgi:hypothetical protein